MALHIIGLATEPVAFRSSHFALRISLSALLTLCQSGAKCCNWRAETGLARILCGIAQDGGWKATHSNTYYAS